jgi:hypothetical protein
MGEDSWYRRTVAAARAAGLRVVHYYVPVNRPWPEQMAAFAKITGPIPPGEGEMFDQDDRGDRPKWPAHYGLNPATEAQRADMRRRYSGVKGLAVWQFTSKLRLPYVNGGQADTDGNEILDPALWATGFGEVSPMDDHEHDVTQDPGWVDDPDWVDELMEWLRAVEEAGG